MPYKTEKWPPKRHFSRRHPEAQAAAGVAAEWSGESKGRTALCQHTAKKECYHSIFSTIRDGNDFLDALSAPFLKLLSLPPPVLTG